MMFWAHFCQRREEKGELVMPLTGALMRELCKQAQ